MEQFDLIKLEKEKVNSGNKFKNGDIVRASDINSIIEGILYNNEFGIKNIKVVTELPQENISTNTLYLLKQADGTCAEYLYIDSKWEQIGSTQTRIDTELSSTSENPVQNKVIKEALDKKLDKVENAGTHKIYGVSSNNVQTMYDLASSSGAYQPNRIPMLVTATSISGDTEPTNGGHLLSAMPQKPWHTTPKQYVDDAVKLYRHSFKMIIKDASNTLTLYINLVSKQATQYTVEAFLNESVSSSEDAYGQFFFSGSFYDGTNYYTVFVASTSFGSYFCDTSDGGKDIISPTSISIQYAANYPKEI